MVKAIVLVLALLALPAGAQGAKHMATATGMFTVAMKPLPAEVAGVQRLALDKSFSGDLAGSSQGQMQSAGDPAKGEAGYVALEVVTGTLAGRSGGFALQHSGTMSGGGQNLSIQIVPGSGSGALAGISGHMAITITEGVHRYTLEYAIPGAP